MGTKRHQHYNLEEYHQLNSQPLRFPYNNNMWKRVMMIFSYNVIMDGNQQNLNIIYIQGMWQGVARALVWPHQLILIRIFLQGNEIVGAENTYSYTRLYRSHPANLRHSWFSFCSWSCKCFCSIGVGTMGAPGAGAPLYFLTVTLCWNTLLKPLPIYSPPLSNHFPTLLCSAYILVSACICTIMITIGYNLISFLLCSSISVRIYTSLGLLHPKALKMWSELSPVINNNYAFRSLYLSTSVGVCCNN